MGIVFKRHTMNFPYDERTKSVSIYRDDMIAQLMHGDEIKTYTSLGNVWKYDEMIRLNEISWWKGRTIFDYNIFIELPVISDVQTSKDNQFFRFDISYGGNTLLKQTPHRFLQLIAPTDAIKKFFHLPIDLRGKSHTVLHLLSLKTYEIKEFVEAKLITKDVLIHGKDGDCNVYEPHLGLNAYVDLLIDVPETSKQLTNRPFQLKARVYLKSVDGVESDEHWLDIAKSTLDFYVKDACDRLVEIYGRSYFIP